jgi:8-oxo-dGTP pyrophosphatase MutT (NUDIX family)
MIDHFLEGDIDVEPRDASVALITIDDGRYLMQLRDQKPGIFYPGHWGVFGGAVDAGEAANDALFRELEEELGFRFTEAQYFTEFTFDFSFRGQGHVFRRYYAVSLAATQLESLTLGEGSAMRTFDAKELLRGGERIVPYDAFAVWLHATRSRNG